LTLTATDPHLHLRFFGPDPLRSSLEAHSLACVGVKFLGDNSKFVATISPDGFCKLWRVGAKDTGSPECSFAPGAALTCMSALPTGHTLTLGGADGRLTILKLRDPEALGYQENEVDLDDIPDEPEGVSSPGGSVAGSVAATSKRGPVSVVSWGGSQAGFVDTPSVASGQGLPQSHRLQTPSEPASDRS